MTKIGIEVLTVHVEVMRVNGVVTAIDADAEVTIVFGTVVVRMCATYYSQFLRGSHTHIGVKAFMPSAFLYQDLWYSSIRK